MHVESAKFEPKINLSKVDSGTLENLKSEHSFNISNEKIEG
jgi:hypothetical protein